MNSYLPLLELFQIFRDKPDSILDYYENCEARIESTEGELGVYKTRLAETARKQALAAVAVLKAGTDPGPLAGMPVSLKDLYGLSHTPIFAGSHAPLPDKWQHEGPLVAQLKEQLAVFPGKTHTVEFAFGGLGVNSHWGSVRNPWDATAHRVSGGSSAGAGSSLIQGGAVLAMGTDTAGSVRIPASWTGTVGLKTSFGRWSLDGIVPLSQSLDTAGVLSRTVSDACFAFAAIDDLIVEPDLFLDAVEDFELSGLRIGIGVNALWEDCAPGIAEKVEESLKCLEKAGAILVNVDLPEVSAAIDLLHKGNVVAPQLDEFVQSEIPQWRDHLDPVVSARIRDGADISSSEYLSRLRQLRELSCRAESRFEECDVFACPTIPISPPILEDVSTVELYRPQNMASLRNTCSANSLSLCAVTLPVGKDSIGMPVGLQLLAPFMEDEYLLAIARAVEKQLGNSIDQLGYCAPLAT